MMYILEMFLQHSFVVVNIIHFQHGRLIKFVLLQLVGLNKIDTI